jgi:hypothetical protein
MHLVKSTSKRAILLCVPMLLAASAGAQEAEQGQAQETRSELQGEALHGRYLGWGVGVPGRRAVVSVWIDQDADDPDALRVRRAALTWDNLEVDLEALGPEEAAALAESNSDVRYTEGRAEWRADTEKPGLAVLQTKFPTSGLVSGLKKHKRATYIIDPVRKELTGMVGANIMLGYWDRGWRTDAPGLRPPQGSLSCEIQLFCLLKTIPKQVVLRVSGEGAPQARMTWESDGEPKVLTTSLLNRFGRVVRTRFEDSQGRVLSYANFVIFPDGTVRGCEKTDIKFFRLAGEVSDPAGPHTVPEGDEVPDRKGLMKRHDWK